MFKPEYLENYLYILKGFGLTLGISVLCFFFGILLGIFFGSCLFLYKKKKWIFLLKFYENFFINTPIVSQVFLFYFLSPFSLDLISVSILILALNSSAHSGLIVVEWLENVRPVYWETAYCLGFTPLKALKKIFIKEMLYRNKKGFFSEFVALIKESSILSFFGVREICLRSKEVGMREYNVAPYILFSSGVYFLFITFLNYFYNKINRTKLKQI